MQEKELQRFFLSFICVPYICMPYTCMPYICMPYICMQEKELQRFFLSLGIHKLLAEACLCDELSPLAVLREDPSRVSGMMQKTKDNIIHSVHEGLAHGLADRGKRKEEQLRRVATVGGERSRSSRSRSRSRRRNRGERRAESGGGKVYSYSSDTVEGLWAPAVKLTAHRSSR